MNPFFGAARWFLVFFYYLPLLMMLVVGQPTELRTVDNYWIYISLFYVATFHVFLELIRPVVYSLNDVPTILKTLYRLLYSKTSKSVIIAIYFCVALFMLGRYGLSIRQGENRISDIGIMAMLLFALRPILFFQVLEDAFFSANPDVGVRKWVSVACVTIYPIAAFDMFYAIIRVFLPLFLQVKRVKLGFILKLTAFGSVLLVATLYFGLVNKVGSEEAVSRIQNFHQHDSELGSYLFKRISVVSQSLNLAIADAWEMNRDPMVSVEICKDAILYRLSILTRLYDYRRPKITTINRLNFLYLCHFDRPSEPGATPGFLALPFFFPIWWFFVVIIVLIVCGITFLLDFRFKHVGEDPVKWSLIALSVLPVMLAFLYNPIDLFISVGPPSVVLLMILGFSGGPAKKGNKNVNADNLFQDDMTLTNELIPKN